MLFRQEATMIIAGIILCLSHTFLLSDAAFTWIRHDASVDFIQGEAAKLVWTVDVGTGTTWNVVKITRGKTSSADDKVIQLSPAGLVKYLSGREADIDLVVQGTSNVVYVTFTLRNLVKTTDEMNYKIFVQNKKYQSDTKNTFLGVFDGRLEFTSQIPQTVIIREGQDLSVNCKARGSPTPVVKWLRLEKGRKVLITEGVGNAVLGTRNIRRESNGTYECQASNDTNNPNVFISNRTDILVQYRPNINSYSSSPLTINSWDDNTLILRCMAYGGNPIPQVSWIGPDKQPIKYGVSQIIGGSLLTMQTVNSQDYGQYRCRASNSIGHVYRYIEVERIVVPDPPVVLKIQSTASTIEITWIRPTLDRVKPIIDYQIAINTKPLRAVSVKDSFVIIAGLSKATNYQVNVLARNVVGYSNATSTYISTKNEDDMANEQMLGSVVLGVCLPIIFILLLIIVLKPVYEWWKRRKEKKNEARSRSSSNNNEEVIYMNDISVEDQVPSNVAQYESVGNLEQHQPATQLYQSLQTQTSSDTYSLLSPDTKLPPRSAVTTNSGVYQDLQGASHQYQSLDRFSRA